MFDSIAPQYDFLNHFLTLGIDKIWRKKVCKIVAEKAHNSILDIASGTGDLAIALGKTHPSKIVGIDISSKMLARARKKVKAKGLSSIIKLEHGDAEALNYQEKSFDIVTCAFGVRNFERMEKGIQEFHRVLSEGGNLVILELSMPENKVIKSLYTCYFEHILPRWGKIISRDMSAYTYLPESVEKFPSKTAFCKLLKDAGFTHCKAIPLSLGIATIFVATK